jgi:uncharacterized repeat protein (TIGR03833 family)
MRGYNSSNVSAGAGSGSGGTQRQRIVPGLNVAIVLKADQRSGALTHGTVADILTNSQNHHRGIKVRLTTGQVGRVQEIKPQGQGSSSSDNGVAVCAAGQRESMYGQGGGGSRRGYHDDSARAYEHEQDERDFARPDNRLSLGAFFPPTINNHNHVPPRESPHARPVVSQAQQNAVYTPPSTSTYSSTTDDHVTASQAIAFASQSTNTNNHSGPPILESSMPMPWTCSICTFENTTYELSCEMCDTVRL